MRLVGVTLVAVLALAVLAAAAGPKPGESIQTTIARISQALGIKGCNGKLRKILHSGYGTPGLAGCAYLRKGLGTFKAPHGQIYGTGAEIDAGTGLSQPATTVLALDSDHRFHVVFVQFEYGSIGSKPNPAFTRNARLAVAAIRRGDCAAFLKVAFRDFGLGGGPEASVCARLPQNSLHKALAADPGASPVPLGGNSLYAFYGLSAGGRYWTIVMSQQPPSAKLPLGSAQYAYVDGYPA
ncbi:MAG TPA: hypothetical protein VHS03_06595 [Gaiellaceae bacterium]|nr:hypothetical protein [Gaiellaceae bacterium]